MKKLYKLLKDIDCPFYSIKKGQIKTVYDWLDEFGVDWLTSFEECINNNPEWFEEIKEV